MRRTGMGFGRPSGLRMLVLYMCKPEQGLTAFQVLRILVLDMSKTEVSGVLLLNTNGIMWFSMLIPEVFWLIAHIIGDMRQTGKITVRDYFSPKPTLPD